MFGLFLVCLSLDSCALYVISDNIKTAGFPTAVISNILLNTGIRRSLPCWLRVKNHGGIVKASHPHRTVHLSVLMFRQLPYESPGLFYPPLSAISSWSFPVLWHPHCIDTTGLCWLHIPP